MDIPVWVAFSICLVVEHVHWHSFCSSTRYRRFIHIIPKLVSLLRTQELIIFKPSLPIFLSIFVQEIDPSAISWPTFTIKSVILWSLHKNVIKCILLFIILNFHTIFVHWIVIAGLDMRVHNDNDTSLWIPYFIIHLCNLRLGEVLRIEEEILIAFRFWVLLSPLDIHPEHIDWETKFSKITIPFNNDFCADWCPLAEIEPQHVYGCHFDKTWYNGQV